MQSAASAPHTSVLAWFDGGATSDFFLYPVRFLVFLCAVQSVQIRSIPPGQKWPGFSFALHLLRVQGFLLCCNTATYKRLQRLLFRPCSYTTHATKQRTGLYRGIFCDCTNSTASNTRLAQAAITSPATRWNTSQRRNTSSAYQIPAPRRTLHSSAQTAYYNNVYKGAEVPACYRSMPDGAAHRRPCQPGGAVQRRAARNYWRLSPQLFSGFRPIANRGQQ